MNAELTILCENTVARPLGLIGEHGFSCLIETAGHGSFLFDTGQGLGLARNADVLGKNLADLRGIVLSHGHFDHSGGLPAALKKCGPVDVFAHPEVFLPRCWAGRHEQRSNGLPYGREELEALGARFVPVTRLTEPASGLFLSGEVPRTTSFETGDPHLFLGPEKDRPLRPDPFLDDLSLAMTTDRGLVVLLGCAHAGMVNILEHFRSGTGCDRVHVVLGGTHLAPAGAEQFAETVRYLKERNVERIGVSHCTGLSRGAELMRELPGKVFFANVGSTFHI